MDERIAQALDQIRAKQDAYRKYSEYYAGKHRLAFATEKFRQAFGSVISAFACNISAVVINTIADRLQVKELRAGAGQEQSADRAREIWTANLLDDRSGRVHREALRSGDAYCIVWKADGAVVPTVYPQYACRMTVGYDPENPGTILWAAKWWPERGVGVRLNLYLPEAILKFVCDRKDGALPEKADAFREWGESPEERNPWGVVPVVHFPADPDIDGWGKSELSDIIPLQDAYNKAICDLMVAMEYQALPQRWAVGVEPDMDQETGKAKETFRPGAGKVWQAAAPDAKFGQFDAADLTQLLAVQQDWEQKIARQAGIPPHYIFIQGTVPSGEALRTLDVPLVKKCEDRQATFGAAWEQTMRLALLMDGRGDSSVSCVWHDPAPATQRERAEIADLHRRAGLPKQYVFASDVGLEGDALTKALSEAQAEQDMATPALGNPFGGGV